MLLPGPEAMQLATYAGWRRRGVPGGLLAGGLFVLPGAAVMLCLATIYAFFGQVPLVDAVFLGVQATVVAIVLEALFRVSKKALQKPSDWVIAALSFVAIFAFQLPFPLIVVAAALWGYVTSRGLGTPPPEATTSPTLTQHACHCPDLAGDLGRTNRASSPSQCQASDRNRAVFLAPCRCDIWRRLCRSGLYGADRGHRISAGSRRPK